MAGVGAQHSQSKESQQFQGYNQYETDDQYLQDLAYKAKFAEEISNNMRVPKSITMEDEDVGSSMLPGSYEYKNHNDNLDAEMKVPSRIVLSRLDSEQERDQNALGVSPEETMNSSGEITPKKLTLNLENDDNSFVAQSNRQIELKTPPRVLGVLDRLETGDTPNINAEQLNKILLLNRQLSVGQAADEAMKNSQSIDLEALNDLLPEEPTSAIIRQQLQQMHRRIITLEKRDAERLKAEKFNQTVLYATCGLAGFAIVVAFAASRASNQLSYY